MREVPGIEAVSSGDAKCGLAIRDAPSTIFYGYSSAARWIARHRGQTIRGERE